MLQRLLSSGGRSDRQAPLHGRPSVLALFLRDSEDGSAIVRHGDDREGLEGIRGRALSAACPRSQNMTNAKNGGAERVTSEDVAGRREAQLLARTDVPSALAIARAIRHPWYRCQALASVADAMSAPARDAALTEAVEAAFQQLEPNRVACAASWPLRVMVRCGHAGVRRLVGRLLDVLATEEHGLRRLDGLAAVIGPLLAIPELRTLAWPSFMATADASTGWRTERIVSWMAAALAEYDKPAAPAGRTKPEPIHQQGERCDRRDDFAAAPVKPSAEEAKSRLSC